MTGHPGMAAQSGPAGKAGRTLGWRPVEALTQPNAPPYPPFPSPPSPLLLLSVNHKWLLQDPWPGLCFVECTRGGGGACIFHEGWRLFHL